MRRSTIALSHSGAHREYQRPFDRHSDAGLRSTTVSTMESGAGSVDVSARPALPWTWITSGNVMSTRSWACSQLLASATEMPGSVVGM